MGILSFFLGASGANGQDSKYISEAAFQSNLARQMAMSPQTVAQLREHGVTPETELKLEYFFYTNTREKAQALADALQARNYSVELGPSASDESVLVVTGWTMPMRMETESVVKWTGDMTRLGYENDCECDGWGTNGKGGLTYMIKIYLLAEAAARSHKEEMDVKHLSMAHKM